MLIKCARCGQTTKALIGFAADGRAFVQCTGARGCAECVNPAELRTLAKSKPEQASELLSMARWLEAAPITAKRTGRAVGV